MVEERGRGMGRGRRKVEAGGEAGRGGGQEGSGEGEIWRKCKGPESGHQHLPPASWSPGLTSNAVFK